MRFDYFQHCFPYPMVLVVKRFVKAFQHGGKAMCEYNCLNDLACSLPHWMLHVSHTINLHLRIGYAALNQGGVKECTRVDALELPFAEGSHGHAADGVELSPS